MKRGHPERDRRLHHRCVVGALVLAFGIASTALAGPSGPRPNGSTLAALPDADQSPERQAFVAPPYCVEETATVASRPGETRPPIAAHTLAASFRQARPDPGAVALAARASDGPVGGRAARWCLAHATSTQAP